jgi:hypothetical protein
MKHKHIIADAWVFTQNNKKMIIWYAFFPALISTLAGIIYLGYQFFAFKSSVLFENWDRSFGSVLVTTILDVISKRFSGQIFTIIIVAIVIILLWLMLPSLCEGSIIQLIARKKNGLPVRTRHGIKFGMLSFMPLFEYFTLIKTFSLMSILGLGSTIARNFGMQAFNTLLPALIIFAIVSIILTLLLTYSEFFVVIDDCKVFKAIRKSCVLVISHLEETILLSILMLIISIRILVQLLFVLLIPIIISGSIYIFASMTLPTVGIVVGAILGLLTLYLASYLSATIHVFAATVWTFTFLELTNEPRLDARGELIKEDEEFVLKQ